MKDNPFASINPGFVFFPAVIVFFLWLASREDNGFVLPCVILTAIIVVAAIWGSQHENHQWQEAATSVGLIYEGSALSGSYRGYKVVLPIDSIEGSSFIDTLSFALNQPVNGEFAIGIESWFGRFGKKVGIEGGQLPGFAERALADPNLQHRLHAAFALQRVELKNSTLTLKYTIIPQRKISDALELARAIAQALETNS